MLNNDGELTDVGAWYLGADATGAEPDSSGAKLHPSLLAISLSALLTLHSLA